MGNLTSVLETDPTLGQKLPESPLKVATLGKS
jgi:hypothetical protein